MINLNDFDSSPLGSDTPEWPYNKCPAPDSGCSDKEGPIKFPITVTFLLCTPRSGSYAISRIMRSPYCLTHHEGGDLDLVLNKNSLKDYSKTFSWKQLNGAIINRMNYFCCDQTNGADLLMAALHCQKFHSLIERKIITVRVLHMTRRLLPASASLCAKLNKCNIPNSPQAIIRAVNAHNDMNQNVVDMIAGERLPVDVCRTADYDDVTTPEVYMEGIQLTEGGQSFPVVGMKRIFSEQFIKACSAIVGSTGVSIGVKKGAVEDESFMTHLHRNDILELGIILEKSKTSYDIPDSEFSDNFNKVLAHYKTNLEEKVVQKMMMEPSDLNTLKLLKDYFREDK